MAHTLSILDDLLGIVSSIIESTVLLLAMYLIVEQQGFQHWLYEPGKTPTRLTARRGRRIKNMSCSGKPGPDEHYRRVQAVADAIYMDIGLAEKLWIRYINNYGSLF